MDIFAVMGLWWDCICFLRSFIFTSLGARNTICGKVSQYWGDIINGDKYEIDNLYIHVTQQLEKTTISVT